MSSFATMTLLHAVHVTLVLHVHVRFFLCSALLGVPALRREGFRARARRIRTLQRHASLWSVEMLPAALRANHPGQWKAFSAAFAMGSYSRGPQKCEKKSELCGIQGAKNAGRD